MTYETVSVFAQTWGLLFFAIFFGVVLAYALWPANKSKFERAAHAPLSEDEPR